MKTNLLLKVSLRLSCGLALSLALNILPPVQASAPKVVYGHDDRQEVAQYPDAQFREMAKSVAGKVRKFKLSTSRFGISFLDFPHITLERGQNVCAKERFSEQLTLPHCSGFLIAPDLIMTAGHCVQTDLDCETSSWVFDFLPETEYLEKKNVYHCKEIVEQNLSSKWYSLQDYAIIKLDRKVDAERKPLKLRMDGHAKKGTRVLVIGHPTGLPLKIADNAKIRPINWIEAFTPIRTLIRKKHYFIADLDAFAGNSGSPVFNQQTGEVEGILIQGATDYVNSPEGQCLVPAHRPQTTWMTVEKTFRVTAIKNLKNILQNAQ